MIFNKNNLPTGFYVYAYIRKKELTPYYIGRGKNGRAWTSHKRQNNANLTPKDSNRIIILEHNLTYIGSVALERFYIKWYGRKDQGTGILINATDGGEGNYGMIHSTETKKKMSVAAKGKAKSIEFVMKMSQDRKGIPWSENRRASQKIKTINDRPVNKDKTEKRITIPKEKVKKPRGLFGENNPMFGKNFSKSHREKIAEYRRGKPLSEETKRKISETKKRKNAINNCV